MSMKEDARYLESMKYEAYGVMKKGVFWLCYWRSDMQGFLKNYLGNDIESERNGRTDAQMAKDLVKEVRDMVSKHAVQYHVADDILKNAFFFKGIDFSNISGNNPISSLIRLKFFDTIDKCAEEGVYNKKTAWLLPLSGR